jgi:hypothetical protein
MIHKKEMGQLGIVVMKVSHFLKTFPYKIAFYSIVSSSIGT